MSRTLVVLFLTLLPLLLFAASARAELSGRTVEYRHGDVVLEGYLAFDARMQGKRPGVLVVHEWWGLNDYARRRADQLAGMGYVAFAVDMYGKGIRTTVPEEAGKLAGRFKEDRALMRSRIRAALDVLRTHERVLPDQIGAIGYCFGGTTVLELARSGADVAGVVSFHGGLGAQNPADAKNIKAKVLVLHGADDPLVPQEEIAAFQKEMQQGGVDWQMIFYGGAVHSFTNPDSGNDSTKGVAYNEKAEKRSWKAMTTFFQEILN